MNSHYLERNLRHESTTGSQFRFLLWLTLSISLPLLILLSILVYRLLRVLSRPKPPALKRPLHRSDCDRNDARKDKPDGNKVASGGDRIYATQSPRPGGNGVDEGAHLLIVLGSGGHTAEMLSILSTLGRQEFLDRFSRRTYVVSSGDGFSAEKARSFENGLREDVGNNPPLATENSQRLRQANGSAAVVVPRKEEENGQGDNKHYNYGSYTITTVHRARKIHQPLYTTPLSALWCVWDCVQVLRGCDSNTHSSFSLSSSSTNGDHHHHHHHYGNPDLILTNGPGTGVCVVLAALLLLVLGFGSSRDANQQRTGRRREGQMRTIYIESWARVKTLSLSGKILKYLVDRFLVQWEKLADSVNADGKMKRIGKIVEYVGPLVN